MKKNIVKLNESQLRKVIAESVKRAIREGIEDYDIFDVVEDLSYLSDAVMEGCIENLRNPMFAKIYQSCKKYVELYEGMRSNKRVR